MCTKLFFFYLLLLYNFKYKIDHNFPQQVLKTYLCNYHNDPFNKFKLRTKTSRGDKWSNDNGPTILVFWSDNSFKGESLEISGSGPLLNGLWSRYNHSKFCAKHNSCKSLSSPHNLLKLRINTFTKSGRILLCYHQVHYIYVRDLYIEEKLCLQSHLEHFAKNCMQCQEVWGLC